MSVPATQEVLLPLQWSPAVQALLSALQLVEELEKPPPPQAPLA